MSRMTFDGVRQKVLNEDYVFKGKRPEKPEGYKQANYVYDENKSVKWNREHQQELETKYASEIKEYTSKSNAKYKEFYYDVLKVLSEEFRFNAKQAEIIFSRAYDDSHDVGLLGVANRAEDLADMVEDIINEILE